MEQAGQEVKKNKSKLAKGDDGIQEIFRQDGTQSKTQTPVKTERRTPVDRIDPNVRGPPVDYSFRKVSLLSELEYGTPRQYRVGIPKKAASGKYISSSLWVNSNHLTDLTAVNSLVRVSFNRPEMVAWLDVSFNEIQSISTEILNLKNLKILYLHGNKIKFFIDVSKLKSLPRLRTLTLHGNPIAEHPNYRALVIKSIPHLVNLDFSLVMKE